VGEGGGDQRVAGSEVVDSIRELVLRASASSLRETSQLWRATSSSAAWALGGVDAARYEPTRCCNVVTGIGG